MKLFKIFLTLFLIVGLIFIISLFFPHHYRVERSITIDKPVEKVYTYMDDLRNWEQWSLWNKQTDSTLVYFYGKRSDSTGGRQYFYGELLKSGRFMLDVTEPNKKIIYDLYMHNGDVNAKGTFLFLGDNNGNTKLTWLDSGDVGYNPLFRFMLPSKLTSTGKTFDDGLLRIKEKIEAK